MFRARIYMRAGSEERDDLCFISKSSCRVQGKLLLSMPYLSFGHASWLTFGFAFWLGLTGGQGGVHVHQDGGSGAI